MLAFSLLTDALIWLQIFSIVYFFSIISLFWLLNVAEAFVKPPQHRVMT